ncbi:MAG: hypothetical protein Fur0032_16740 [Terrimicrobiaceae bacterium]
MKTIRLLVIGLWIGVVGVSVGGCSTSSVAARQEAISNAQGQVLSNRAARIQARDQRMWDARDVWFP